MCALIDCNSFYANCEKLFRPDLKGKPVVVLANNDGFTDKQLILVDKIILRAQNDNYADIVVKGSLELFGMAISNIRRFKK